MSKLVSTLAMGIAALALTACGGDSGQSGFLAGPGSSTSSGSGTTTSASSTVSALAVSSSVATVPPDGSSTAAITVTAKNASNVAISGATVFFASSAGTLAVTSATTNSSGQATATLSGAGVAVGTNIVVTAAAGSVSKTATIAVANSSGTASASALSLTSSAATIPADGSATATIVALARNSNNNLIAGAQICFTASSGGLVVSNGSNGCVTTDINGSATATLSTAGDSTLRTITVTGTTGSLTPVTATVQVVPAVASTTVQFGNTGITGASAFTAGQIALGSNATSVSTGGTTSLAVAIVDQNGNLYSGSSVPVKFSSTCLANGNANIAAAQGGTVSGNTVTTTTGFASVTYTNVACTTSDAVTATVTVNGQSYIATGSVTDQPASLGSIQFESASQTTIGLKGTGLNQTSVLTFKVLNSTGGPYQGAQVSFALNTSVGGVALAPATATSGSDGTVQTTVSSGTQHTTVRVTASISSPATLSTQSSQLTITTGLPTSNAFSISIGKSSNGNLACPNIESWGIDGVTAPINVYLSDRYANPVPDGTAVAFTSDAGQIVGACNTLAGNCSVTWTSANPRPSPDPTTSPTNPATPTLVDPSIVNGRGMILATTIGEESFDDANGTGYYAVGEAFADLGEPYRDDNENGQYDAGEYFLDFHNTGAHLGPSGSFVGITCTSTTCMQNTLAIGASFKLTMSTSFANITVSPMRSSNVTLSGTLQVPSVLVPTSGGTIVFNVQDQNGNSMGAGTSLAVTSTANVGATLLGSNVVGCDAGTGGQYYGIVLTPGAGVGSGATATVTLNVTSPSGAVTSVSFPVTVQ